MSDQVWYAAYGSNLHWPRFRCYLQGGRAPGGSRVHTPCRDPRPPRCSVPDTLPFPLFFAGASPTWGGGVAFLDPTRREATTLARLYLITREQFAGVAAGEAHRTRVSLPGRHTAAPGWYTVAPGRYGTVLRCGQRDGRAVLTVTSTPATIPLAAPRPAYVRTIAAGLEETHGLGPRQAADYLARVPGIAGAYHHDDLVAAATPTS